MNEKENDKKKREEDLPEKGLEKGYANRHAETTQPGKIRRQEIPPEIEGDPEEVHSEADRRRQEGVERGYANRHAEVAGAATGDLPEPAPFSRPRTTAPPEGGYEAGFPKVYFSVYDRVPPIVVKTPNEETGIDKANFMTVPPEEVSTELTDAKMRAEWRVGDRAAERDLTQRESRSAFSPAPGESERRDRSRDEQDRIREEDRKREEDRQRERETKAGRKT